tara:strand:+ start:1428 stop:1670 length:243 start_codon:yes stop_codon:yes gene_type:complete
MSVEPYYLGILGEIEEKLSITKEQKKLLKIIDEQHEARILKELIKSSKEKINQLIKTRKKLKKEMNEMQEYVDNILILEV